MAVFVFAQACGVLDCLLYIVGIFHKDKKNILTWQAVGCAIVSLQYLLLGLYDSCASNVVALIRNLVFSRRKSRAVLMVIYLAYIIIAAATWNGIWTVGMFLGSIGKATFMYRDNEQHIRIMNALFHAYWVVYGIHFAAYASAISNAVMFMGCMLSFLRYRKEYSKIR